MSIHPLKGLRSNPRHRYVVAGAKQAKQISPEHWLIAVKYLCIILAVLWILAAIVMAGGIG